MFFVQFCDTFWEAFFFVGFANGGIYQNASIPGIASQQLVAYEDLKGKLEFFVSQILLHSLQ